MTQQDFIWISNQVRPQGCIDHRGPKITVELRVGLVNVIHDYSEPVHSQMKVCLLKESKEFIIINEDQLKDIYHIHLLSYKKQDKEFMGDLIKYCEENLKGV